jgi:hypothetical protein
VKIENLCNEEAICAKWDFLRDTAIEEAETARDEGCATDEGFDLETF